MKAYVAVLIALAFACGSHADAPPCASEVDRPQRAGQGRAWHNQRGHGVRDTGVPLPAKKVKGTPVPRVAQPRGAAPANDMFADRISIAGVTGSTPGNNTDATLEAGEPRYSNNHGSNTVWWTWTAPATGRYSFDTFGSAFDTTLAIWQGASLAVLALVDYNDDWHDMQSLCVVQAASGVTYQIQVNGYWANEDFGAITLQWSPVLWNKSVTNAQNEVWLTQKGDALQRVARDIRKFGTNYFGTEIPGEVSTSPLVVSIADKSGKKMVDNQPVPNVANGAWIVGFDGKQVVIVTGQWGGVTWGHSGQGAVFVYHVAKGGLTQVGSATIASNAYDAWLVPGGIYVALYNNASKSGLQLWHKNLKKVLWELPMAEGWLDKIYDKGVSFFTTWTGSTNEITIRKKTKKLGALTLVEPAGRWLYWLTDDKGGVLHWSTQLGTNGPLTLVKPDGKKVFESFMPAGLETFAECLYNGKQIWFRKGGYGVTVTLTSYKPGPQPTLNGAATVANYASGGIRGANSYSASYSADASTVRGHDKKLAAQWEKTQAGWLWNFFDKDVYSIFHPTPATDDCLMFKKDKAFCTHSYPVPE